VNISEQDVFRALFTVYLMIFSSKHLFYIETIFIFNFHFSVKKKRTLYQQEIEQKKYVIRQH